MGVYSAAWAQFLRDCSEHYAACRVWGCVDGVFAFEVEADRALASKRDKAWTYLQVAVSALRQLDALYTKGNCLTASNQ